MQPQHCRTELLSPLPNSKLLEANGKPLSLITHRSYSASARRSYSHLPHTITQLGHQSSPALYQSKAEGEHRANCPRFSQILGRRGWPCPLTWQDKVAAVLRAQHLQQPLLHPFDLLPAREEAQDPTWNTLRVKNTTLKSRCFSPARDTGFQGRKQPGYLGFDSE